MYIGWIVSEYSYISKFTPRDLLKFSFRSVFRMLILAEAALLATKVVKGESDMPSLRREATKSERLTELYTLCAYDSV